METAGLYSRARFALSKEAAFRFVPFVVGYLLIAIFGNFFLTGELDITTLSSDIEPFGVSVLYPLVLLYGFPAIIGIFVGQTTICTVNGLLGFWEPLPFGIGILRLIPLSVAFYIVTRIKLAHARLFVGCWIITGINFVILKLLGIHEILLVWGLPWTIVASNILGFLLLRSLSFQKFELTRNTFAILGACSGIMTLILPWLANPPGYWFLWGFTLGGGIWIFRARDPLLYVTLFLIALGSFLVLLSDVLAQNNKKKAQITGGFCRAFGIIAFIMFILTVILPTLGHVTLLEALSLVSYGFLIELAAQLISLLSLDW